MHDDLTLDDILALTGAAKFFEDTAKATDLVPLTFAQAIRRVLPIAQMMVDMGALSDAPLTAGEKVAIGNSWNRFVESLPAARVINDNQPGAHAIIEVLRDPPTLPVGTVLYASYRGYA